MPDPNCSRHFWNCRASVRTDEGRAGRRAQLLGIVLALLLAWAGGARSATGHQAADAGANAGRVAVADTTWSMYTVRPGDTLFAISRRHDVAVDSLRAWNRVTAGDLKAGLELRVGYELTQPTPGEAGPAAPMLDAEPAPAAPAPDSTHLTLFDVMASYGLVDSVHIWQPGSPAWLRETAVKRTTALRPPRVHVVTAGETLFGVSRTYGVDPDRLREVNKMTGTALRIGQELRIPGSDGSVTASGLDVLPPVHDIVSVLAWPSSFEGQPLRSGDTYDPANWLAGHAEWPIGTVLLLENPENRRMALARVADRTPGPELGILDVSHSVYEALGLRPDESEPPGSGPAPAPRVRVRLLPWSVVR